MVVRGPSHEDRRGVTVRSVLVDKGVSGYSEDWRERETRRVESVGNTYDILQNLRLNLKWKGTLSRS